MTAHYSHDCVSTRTNRRAAFLAAACLMVLLAPRLGDARVVRFVVEQRRPVTSATDWGKVGSYERLDGTAIIEVDPRDPFNAVIVNLDKAPRNARGNVEFSAPFIILKPVDMSRGNRKIFYGVSSENVGIRRAGQQGMCENPSHDFQFLGGAVAPIMRALLVALDAWADRGVEPPPSNYPRVEDGTLVSVEGARHTFPTVPALHFPGGLPPRRVLNFGPEFSSQGGRLTLLPPALGPAYALFVPKPDNDGLDVAGVPPIEVRAPLGTNTGWNVRAAGRRGGELCGLNGSFIPFAKTKAERMKTGDPRLSLEERYGNHAGFVRAVEQATRELVKERLLLPEDAEKYVQKARVSKVLR